MSLELRGVTFTHPSADEAALRDVSLACAPGGVTLVTGRLGAGASTLLLVASGLAPRVTGGELEGTVRVEGRAGLLRSKPWTQLSGMAYSVWTEVGFGPANLGWPRDRIGQCVDRELDRLRLTHLADRDPRTLSGGELQRVMLAGILAMEPEVLLLDEPAGELDPVAAGELYSLLPALARSRTVVIATADVDRAVEAAARVVVLEDGTVAADGTPQEVLAEERWVASRMSTTVAEVVRLAGCRAPYPVTLDDAVRRFA